MTSEEFLDAVNKKLRNGDIASLSKSSLHEGKLPFYQKAEGFRDPIVRMRISRLSGEGVLETPENDPSIFGADIPVIWAETMDATSEGILKDVDGNAAVTHKVDGRYGNVEINTNSFHFHGKTDKVDNDQHFPKVREEQNGAGAIVVLVDKSSKEEYILFGSLASRGNKVASMIVGGARTGGSIESTIVKELDGETCNVLTTDESAVKNSIRDNGICVRYSTYSVYKVGDLDQKDIDDRSSHWNFKYTTAILKLEVEDVSATLKEMNKRLGIAQNILSALGGYYQACIKRKNLTKEDASGIAKSFEDMGISRDDVNWFNKHVIAISSDEKGEKTTEMVVPYGDKIIVPINHTEAGVLENDFSKLMSIIFEIEKYSGDNRELMCEKDYKTAVALLVAHTQFSVFKGISLEKCNEALINGISFGTAGNRNSSLPQGNIPMTRNQGPVFERLKRAMSL